MTNEPILVARDIVKTYGKDFSFRSGSYNAIDVELFGGEIYGIVGPNGAGKSTFFDVLSGLASLDSGTVMLSGCDITRCSPSKIARLGMARTFQFPRRIPATNTPVSSLTDLLRRRQRKSRFDVPRELPETAAQGPVADRLRNLRLALQSRAKVLLLDEPLTGLSEGQTSAVADTLRDLKQQGCAVLVAEHDLGFVMRHADKVIFIDGGYIRSDPVVPAELLSNARFQTLMWKPFVKKDMALCDYPASAHLEVVEDHLVLNRFSCTTATGMELVLAHDCNLGRGIHQVTGPHGAGKSAFLRALVGRTPARWDRLSLPGIKPCGRGDRLPSLDTLVRTGIRWAPEDASHVDALTVAEILSVASGESRIERVRLHGGTPLREMFPELVDQRGKRPRQLSGGVRQMLNLARAFVGKCKILLLDRPFQNLSAGVVADVEEYLARLAYKLPILIVQNDEIPRLQSVIKSRLCVQNGRITVLGPVSTRD